METLKLVSINHRAMETIQAIADNGIERPRDLAGRRVAFNPTPQGLAMVRHLVRADGGDPSQILSNASVWREAIDDSLLGETSRRD